MYLYKLANSYKIHQGLHFYTFREVISEFEGLLVQLNWASAEDAAEGALPAEANTTDEHPWDSIPLYGGTMYRFTTSQGSAHRQMSVWPGDNAAAAAWVH